MTNILEILYNEDEKRPNRKMVWSKNYHILFSDEHLSPVVS